MSATDYASRGMHVLPLHVMNGVGHCTCGKKCASPAKHPLTKNGLKDATADVAVVERWEGIYGNHNIGIRTGAVSGIVVLDVDGTAGLEQLKAQGPIPRTPTVRTGRGPGHGHLYFKHPGFRIKPVAGILPGLDIRGDDSYVVAPPSVHASGTAYTWAPGLALDDVEFDQLPPWVVEKLTDSKTKSSAGAPPPAGGRKYRPGERGGRIRYLFGKLNAEGVSLELIKKVISEENENWFDPPKAEADLNAEVDVQWELYKDENRSGPNQRGGTVGAQPGEPVELAAIPEYPTSALTRGLRDLVQEAAAASLPAGLAAAAGLGALAAAIGPNATIQMAVGWEERAILWPVLMAPRGAGKSPCQDLAFGRLRANDELLHAKYRQDIDDWLGEKKQDRGDPPIDPTILGGDLNLESMARLLRGKSAIAIDADELQQWILGLGEYKNRGGSGDRGRVLKLWSGEPWRYTRVGAGGQGLPAVDILVTRPTVVICGGLQPELHHLLGGEQDGHRPRWLLHLAAIPERSSGKIASAPFAWLHLLEELLQARDKERQWSLAPAAKRAFQEQRARWKQQARGTENASVSAALDKADKHLLRVTLALAEAEYPARGGEVHKWLVEHGIAAVEFSLDSWRALPENEGLALSIKDERLDRAVNRLLAWLEGHGGRATKRDLIRAKVAGARTVLDLDQLVTRYVAVYPGTVRQEAPAAGGPVATVIYAPRRSLRVVDVDNDRDSHKTAEEPTSEYESPTVDNAVDNDLGVDNEESVDNDEGCQHTTTSTVGGVSTCVRCGQEVAR